MPGYLRKMPEKLRRRRGRIREDAGIREDADIRRHWGRFATLLSRGRPML
jgi:hypothetical protein